MSTITDAELDTVWNDLLQWDKEDLVAMILENWSDHDYQLHLKWMADQIPNPYFKG